MKTQAATYKLGLSFFPIVSLKWTQDFEIFKDQLCLKKISDKNYWIANSYRMTIIRNEMFLVP